METPSLSYLGEAAGGTSPKEFRLQRKRQRGDLASTGMAVEVGKIKTLTPGSLYSTHSWLRPAAPNSFQAGEMRTRAWSNGDCWAITIAVGYWKCTLMGQGTTWYTVASLYIHPSLKKIKAGAHSTVMEGIYPEWSKQNNLSLLAHKRAKAPLMR